MGVCTGNRDRTLSKSNYATGDLGTKKTIINDYRIVFKKVIRYNGLQIIKNIMRKFYKIVN